MEFRNHQKRGEPEKPTSRNIKKTNHDQKKPTIDNFSYFNCFFSYGVCNLIYRH